MRCNLTTHAAIVMKQHREKRRYLRTRRAARRLPFRPGMIQRLDDETVTDERLKNQLPPRGFAVAIAPGHETDLPSTDLQVRVLKTAGELRTLTPAWERLVETAIEPNAFYEPSFLMSAFEHLPTRGVLVVAIEGSVRVRPDDRRVLCGLFPLQRRRGVRGLPVPALEMWQHEHCYLTTPLVRRDMGRETVAAFLDWQAADRSRLLHIPQISAGGPVDDLFTELLACRGSLRVVRDRYARAAIVRRSSIDDVYRIGCSRKRRHELRRLERKFSESGNVKLDVWNPNEDPAPWIEDFLRLETSGWKGEAGSALAQSTANRNFLESMICGAAITGRLQMLRMRLDARTVAIKINLLSGGGAFCFKIAFDPQLARFSPGVLLEIANLREMHKTENDIAWMDSCATTNHPMIDSLWPDRRSIESIVVPNGKRSSQLLAALVAVARASKLALSRKQTEHRTLARSG